MARQPNYDFERRERDRLKKLKKAERAEAKRKPVSESEPADTGGPRSEASET